MCHIKKIFLNLIKIKNIKNIRYFQTKISDIYPIYINDIYQANPVVQKHWNIHIVLNALLITQQ